MSSVFHPALLLPRGIRATRTNRRVVVSPESDAAATTTPDSPKRKSKFDQVSHGMRRRLSRATSNNNKKKKKKYYLHDMDLPEQAPLLFYPVPITHNQQQTPTSPVLFWMQHGCPQDVVPKILAYCGPKTTATLYQCSRFWHDLISEDDTWRILCEELYKWNDGDEEPSCSWRQFYARNPCVPIDYSHVADAVAALGPPRTEAEGDEMPTMTIWLRPQEHRLQESLLLQAGHAKVTLETMTTTTTHKKRRPLASLLLQTRRRNKPLLHIAAGHVTLRRIRLGHYCGGLNLWNGNAAVQIQPVTPQPRPGEDPPSVEGRLLPSATLQEVEVISHSGRGVVINDGGNVTIQMSYIHDCAATGIYVGSHHCQLMLEHSDLISNGHGNQLAASVRASGVGRGHSGFYLENGNATLHQVNISNNSSCGISVSSAESNLLLDHSDVVANGHSNQVEVAFGSQQMGSSNHVAKSGLVKVRSRLGLQSCCGRGLGISYSGTTGGRRTRRGSLGSLSERDLDDVPSEEEEAEETEDDLEHLQESFVVAEENVRFGELIEI